MSPSDFLSPVITQSYAQMAAVDGAVAEPDPVPLRNPNRTAMLVDSIRFRFPLTAGSVLTRPNFIGSQFLAELWLGGTKLTNGPQPIASFCPAFVSYAMFPYTATWNLPRPMYVPPNVPITAKFTQKLPQATGVDALAGQFGISTVGRSMPAGMPIPENIFVPWVSSTTVYKAVTTWESADNELGNPFNQPMKLKRLVGFNGKTQSREIPGGATTLLYANRAPDFTIQATFSNQKMLIREPTPFFAVFPGERPFMRLNNTLQPKEFIRVYLDMTAIGAQDVDLAFTTVGMVGYREMPTPQGALP